jgi:hypothetical protein
MVGGADALIIAAAAAVAGKDDEDALEEDEEDEEEDEDDDDDAAAAAENDGVGFRVEAVGGDAIVTTALDADVRVDLRRDGEGEGEGELRIIEEALGFSPVSKNRPTCEAVKTTIFDFF